MLNFYLVLSVVPMLFISLLLCAIISNGLWLGAAGAGGSSDRIPLEGTDLTRLNLC